MAGQGRRDASITAPPGAHHRPAADRPAYFRAMIDRAIGGGNSRVGEVLRDLTLRRVFVVAVVVQLLDALSTAAGLRVGLPERNPFTLSVLQAYGPAGLLLQKVVVDCLLLSAMARLPRRTSMIAVLAVTGVTAAVVLANLAGLVTAR
jgi:uncharacterized protein DUF5658